MLQAQFTCDNPRCRKITSAVAPPETICREMNKVLENGWKRCGTKIFCPDCADGHIESGSTSDLRITF
jgi:hypothetical protein